MASLFAYSVTCWKVRAYLSLDVAQLKENVNGEGILQLIASYYDEGRVCIVTKLYNGGNLFDR